MSPVHPHGPVADGFLAHPFATAEYLAKTDARTCTGCQSLINPATADFKASAQEFLDRADAVVVHAHDGHVAPSWKSVSLRPVESRPMFFIQPPNYLPTGLVNFVRSSLAAKSVP